MSSFSYINDNFAVQTIVLISQKPFLLPFFRSIMPFSTNLTVMVLTVRSDLPICTAISFCVALGCSRKKLSTAISSKVQSKVQILHFRGISFVAFALCLSCGEDSCISIVRFFNSLCSDRIKFRKKASIYSVVAYMPLLSDVKSESAQVLYSKNCRCAGVAFSKSMYLLNSDAVIASF